MKRLWIAAVVCCVATGCCGNCPSNDTSTPTGPTSPVSNAPCCEAPCCEAPCCATSPVSAAIPGEKGKVVEFDSMKSTAPASWKHEDVKVKLRYMQFRLPKVKDDPADAEVVIFKGIGGSAKANIDRWKGMFRAPEGKKIEDVSKVSSFEVGKAKVAFLDVAGTYMYKSAPFDPNAKTEPRANSRMLGVVFEGPDDVYHVRLVGYADTVEHYRKGFEEWVRNFK